MSKLQLPIRRRRTTPSSEQGRPPRQIPRWLTIMGLLGGIAFGLLGYLDRQQTNRAKEREDEATTTRIAREALRTNDGPVILISQEADPIDPTSMAEAFNTLDELIAKRPSDAAPLAAKSVLSIKSGNDQAAKNLAHKALELDPELPSALNTLALLDARTGNVTEAKSGFEKARDSAERQDMALDRDVAKLNLAMTLAGLGDLDKARKELEGPLHNPMTQAVAHNTLGNLLVLEGRVSDASEAYLIASKDESFIGAAQNLACSYKLQKRTEEYEQQLAKIRAQGGSEPSCDPQGDFAPNVGVKGAMAYWQMTRDF